jgi:hypothetical protein
MVKTLNAEEQEEEVEEEVEEEEEEWGNINSPSCTIHPDDTSRIRNPQIINSKNVEKLHV